MAGSGWAEINCSSSRFGSQVHPRKPASGKMGKMDCGQDAMMEIGWMSQTFPVTRYDTLMAGLTTTRYDTFPLCLPSGLWDLMPTFDSFTVGGVRMDGRGRTIVDHEQSNRIPYQFPPNQPTCYRSSIQQQHQQQSMPSFHHPITPITPITPIIFSLSCSLSAFSSLGPLTARPLNR